MNKLMRKKRKKGFTLIELIVVIAILGILAGIAVPRFRDVTDGAAIGAAEANHRTLVSAVIMAQTQSGGTLPAAAGAAADGLTGVDNLAIFIQGGKASLVKSGVTHAWDGTTLTTTINKTAAKYVNGTNGNVTITVVANTSTTFTTTFN